MLFPVLLSFTFIPIPLEVDSSQSSVSAQIELSAFVPGTIIGNWDEKTNPKGTSTLPGYWGGSGNNPIDCEITSTLGGPMSSPCEGGFSIEMNTSTNLMTIDDLYLDAHGNGPASIPLTLEMFYETFRTVQPDSLFVGDIPITIPLFDAQVTTLRFDQVLETVAVLTPVDELSWTYKTLVPVAITIELEMFGISTGPLLLPGILPFSGAIVQTDLDIHLTGDFSFDVSEGISDLPLPIDNFPFEIPTILPPGNTANLLLNAVVESMAITTGASINIVATGMAIGSADVNSDGLINVTDLLSIMDKWGSCDGCNEDLNHDGIVGVVDLYIVIGNWTRSIP